MCHVLILGAKQPLLRDYFLFGEISHSLFNNFNYFIFFFFLSVLLALDT